MSKKSLQNSQTILKNHCNHNISWCGIQGQRSSWASWSDQTEALPFVRGNMYLIFVRLLQHASDSTFRLLYHSWHVFVHQWVLHNGQLWALHHLIEYLAAHPSFKIKDHRGTKQIDLLSWYADKGLCRKPPRSCLHLNTDLVYRHASDFTFVPYNKLHVGNYEKFHYDTMSDGVVLSNE